MGKIVYKRADTVSYSSYDNKQYVFICGTKLYDNAVVTMHSVLQVSPAREDLYDVKALIVGQINLGLKVA